MALGSDSSTRAARFFSFLRSLRRNRPVRVRPTPSSRTRVRTATPARTPALLLRGERSVSPAGSGVATRSSVFVSETVSDARVPKAKTLFLGAAARLLAILEVGGGCRKRLVDRPKSRAVCLSARNDGVRHMSARRARVRRLAFEGAPTLSLGGQIYPEHPFEVRGRSLFRQIAGRDGRATSGVRPAAAPKGAGPPRSRANRILGEQDFLAVYSTAQTPGSRARGVGVVGRLGDASKGTLDSLADAAKRVKWLSKALKLGALSLVSFRRRRLC